MNNKIKYYNLTIPQNNIWMVENFFIKENVNVVAGTFAVKYGFDASIAKKVVNKFIELNDATRIRIVVDNGKFFQYIEKYKPIEVQYIDISNMTINQINSLKQSIISKKIDIMGNLFNFIILDRKDGYGEFLLKEHHMISDAWSVSKIGNALQNLYEKIAAGETEFDKEPSYIEFIEQEDLYRNSPKYQNDKFFWEEYLLNLPETTYLKDQEYDSIKAKRYNRKIDIKLSEKINKFCKENRVSQYSVFLTAVSIYLHRVSQNNDFTIGTPVLNRANYNQKQMQGMFVNTLPIRFKIDENETFLNMCKTTALNSMQIFKHQKYPYENMVKQARKENGTKKDLFSVAFSYQNARSNINLDRYEITWIPNGTIQEQLEIHILDLNNCGILEFDIDYLTELFKDEEIKLIADRLLTIVEQGIEKNSTIENIEIMSKKEKNFILNEINNTKKEYCYNKNVLDFFEEQVKNKPNEPALIFEQNSMSYDELDKKSNDLATFLENSGAKEKDRIGICIDKSFELLISILAVLKVGATYVPMDDNYSIDRKKCMIQDANIKICICDKIQKFDDTKQINIKRTNYKNNGKFISKAKINCNSPVCILYTSGTTGKPKGVEIINRNIIKLVTNIDYMDFSENDRILQVASTVFDLSIFEFWTSLLNGHALCLIKKENLLNFKYLKQYIDECNATIMCITSVLFNQMVAENIKIFENIKQVLVGGDKLSIKHIKKLKETYKYIKIYNSYGPTETTSFCNMYEINDIKSTNIPIGKPISNSLGYVIDSKNRLLPLEVKGEYAIGGDGVSNGYINNSKLTSEKFIPNIFNDNLLSKKIYKTGDIVYFDIKGNVNFIGRKDNQVKIKGYRIELDEIRRAVLSYESISDCAIVIKENEKNINDKKILVYFVSCKKESIEKLFEYLKKHLQKYMIPQGIMQIESIPMTTNYKLDKSKLPEIKQEIMNDNEPLATKMQEEISKIIFDILNIKVSPNENLFSMGLDSLSAITLANAISEKYNIEISTKDVMENDTIKDLEMLINKSKKVSKSKNKKSEFTITSGEKSIFLEWLKTPNSTLYNAPFELKFNKKIDIIKLKKAIQDTINNNPKMYSSFNLVDNEITRFINKEINYNIKVENVTTEEYKIIHKQFVEPFNLTKAPLFKIEIYVTPRKIYALFDIHHIIFDGASFAIFIKEILNRYNEDKIISSKSYIGKSINNKEKFNEAKKYFLDMFKGELPVNDLPYDKLRPLERSFKGNNIILNINRQTTEQIYKYLIDNKVTLNSLLQSAFTILMAKYTYNEDIIIGTAVSGRDGANENEIGMNVKTVPYRTQIDWNKSILEYVKETQNKMINVIDNSIYSYDSLVKDLKLKRNDSRNLLFDAMFVCQNIHLSELKFGKTYAELSGFNRTTSKFDITFETIPKKNKIELNTEYSTDLFNKNTILNMEKHYINILKSMIDSNNKNLFDIKMISNAEQDIIFNKFNNNKTHYPQKTVCQIFEQRVEEHPNKTAIVFEDKSLTYEQLNEKANMIARYLQSKGLKRGDVAAIMIDKSLDYLPAALAILKCGAVYTPIINDLPDERAKYMMENAKSKFIITTKKFYRNISNIETIFIDNEQLYNKYPKENLNLEYDIDDLLHIIYTSGSTGLPKGNMIKNRGMVRLLLNTNYVDYTENDVMLATGSLTFDISGFELWGAMLYGMTLHFITKEHSLDIHYYADYIEKNKITTTFIATPIFHLMVEENVDMFKNMHAIYVGGERLLPKYTNILYKKYKNVKVYNAYGPAEITVICCAKLISKIYKTYEDIPLGKIASNNTVLVLDKCQQLCPIGIPGELYVWGDGLGKGYVNRDDLTQEKFGYIKGIKGLSYRSGDLTKWNKAGEIRYLGRIDTQIKIRGQRIELSEIQNRILKLHEIKEVALVVKDLGENNKCIVCYYCRNKNIDENSIVDYLKQYLPIYMIPSKFVLLNKMPYNQNGKIDRHKLPEISLVDNNTNSDNAKPKNKEQEIILNVFKDTLKNNSLNMNSDFFENGGDSLEVSKLVANFQCKNIEIVYADIFKYKTPMEIYEYLYLSKNTNTDVSDITSYDYKEIDKILSLNTLKNESIIINKNPKNVLITGVTGFLGVHILKEIAKNQCINKIYCLVREKDNLNTETRFKNQLNFFFTPQTVKMITSKAVVVDGDITDKDIFKTEIKDKIDIVINSAARIKHYGEYQKFYDVNVRGVENLINFCLKENAQLIQMSTLSVSGNIIEQGQTIQNNIQHNTIFNEKNLYINQNLENVYVNTKYLAELKILDAVSKQNLKAKIMRLGNLTGRYKDGKFQPNVEDNAFANRIKSLIELKTISKEMYNKYIEMTPIDLVSIAISKLIMVENCDYTIFHLFNHKHIDMKSVLAILEKLNTKIDVQNEEEVAKKIREYMKDEEKFNSIKGIIPDIDKNGKLMYNDTTIIKSDFTKKVLKKLGFEWPEISTKYLVKYFKYLDKINFIKLGEKHDK